MFGKTLSFKQKVRILSDPGIKATFRDGSEINPKTWYEIPPNYNIKTFTIPIGVNLSLTAPLPPQEGRGVSYIYRYPVSIKSNITANALKFRATALFETDNFIKASHDYKLLADENPENSDLAIRYIQTLCITGKLGLCADTIKIKNNVIANGDQRQLFAGGEMLRRLHESLTQNPVCKKKLSEECLKTSDGQYFAGEALLWTKEVNRAIPYLEKAAAINPNHCCALYNLGRSYANTGRYNEGVTALKKELKVRPDDIDLTFRA